MERECPKCGTVTDWPEGSGACPIYHGRTGDGYCPIFVDAATREEQATRGLNGGPPIEPPVAIHSRMNKLRVLSFPAPPPFPSLQEVMRMDVIEHDIDEDFDEVFEQCPAREEGKQCIYNWRTNFMDCVYCKRATGLDE